MALIPYCCCRNLKAKKGTASSNNAKETTAADGETCDFCGYYVKWGDYTPQDKLTEGFEFIEYDIGSADYGPYDADK